MIHGFGMRMKSYGYAFVFRIPSFSTHSLTHSLTLSLSLLKVSILAVYKICEGRSSHWNFGVSERNYMDLYLWGVTEWSVLIYIHVK
jgi:hypothetical protein